MTALNSDIFRPKRLAKRWLCTIFEKQVVELRQRQPQVKFVAVVGSMGKTSTKLALAHTLEATGWRVQYQAGNYNDRLTVPLVVFGQELPALSNLAAWRRLWRANRQLLKSDYPYDVVVLELGTDAPGQINEFAYLKPDLTVVTAVAPEHMEFFGDLSTVANEELSVANFSHQLLLNSDDVPAEYRRQLKYRSYSLIDSKADYSSQAVGHGLTGQNLRLKKQNRDWCRVDSVYLGSQGQKIVLAAAAATDLIRPVETRVLALALSGLEPFAGRMQLLKGIHDSVIIDDTYNASPAAVEAALTVLTKAEAPQRIAVLGSMNELGEFGPEAHRAIGASLDNAKIDAVITIGQEAKDYLAPTAEAAGCLVTSFLDPVLAGRHVRKLIKNGAVILFKGSQNGVFAEEAIKAVLADPADANKLVRQSSAWMAKKHRQFKSIKLS